MSTKRILSLVLALVMVLGTFGTVFAAEPTENDRVNKLIELGLVKGDGTGYRLNDTIRRDEVAAMVVRSMDLESVANAMINVPTKFVDVKAGEWNNGYVAVAEGRGITKGTSANTFSPARPITYSEVAAMLVRVIGLDPKVEEKFVWPASYIAEAHKLGILADVEIANMGEAAVREKVFEMVYNTINNKNANLLVASTVEGIVVENYRTENLAKDEIVVHVMKDQVQRTDSKYYEEGDEVRIVINADLKKAGHDVETLLGKVVTVSFDKDEKVVDIKVNNNYTYLQGALTEANSKELQLEGKWYTVGKAEARTAVDERLYQVYFNNEDVHYSADLKSDDFLDLVEDYDEAEFARITVRNGKVLFIDAFAFEDIAPVAKEIDAKDRVSYYDDSKDGAINTLVVDEDAYVINFVDSKMTLGNYKDIDTNDVIHYFEGDKDVLTVFVRPSDDNKVEGEYKEANAAKAKDAADIKILVDKTEYKADIKTENRNPVYSVVASDYEFYRLTEDYDDELADFEKEEVLVLRDMFGKVQLISTEKIDGRFYAVISDLYNYDFKLVKTDNTNTWYDTDRDTVLSGTGTREQRINNFDKNDLVLASAKEDLLTKLELIEADFGPEAIEKITKDVVDFGSRFYYIGKKTVLFDVTGKTPKGMTVADFIKNYDLDKTVKGYVVENGKDAKLVDVIVITEATAKDNAKYEDLIVKVTRVRVTGTTYRLTVVDAAGETATYYVDEDVAEEMLTTRNLQVVAGSIVEITVPKEADKDGNKEIKEMTEIIDEKQPVFKVLEVGRDRARNENYMVLADGSNPVVKKTVWVSRIADVFGDYKVGSYVSIEGIDKYNTTFVVDVRSDKYDMAVWEVEVDEDQVAADAVIAKIEALPTEITLDNKTAVEEAREAYEALTLAQQLLVTNLAKLTQAEAKIVELTPAPGKPEVEDATVGGNAVTVANDTVEVKYAEETEVIPAVTVNFKDEVKVKSITDKTGKVYDTEAQLEEAKEWLGYTGALTALTKTVTLTGTTKTFADVIAKLGDSFKVTVVNEAGETLTLTINLKLDVPAPVLVRDFGEDVYGEISTVPRVKISEDKVLEKFPQIKTTDNLIVTIGTETFRATYKTDVDGNKFWSTTGIQSSTQTITKQIILDAVISIEKI